MSGLGPGRRAVVWMWWLVVLGLAATAYWFVLHPMVDREVLADKHYRENQRLRIEAQNRGIKNLPEAPPGQRSAEYIKANEDLKLILTGQMVPGTPLAIALDSFSGYAVFRTPAFKDALKAAGLSLELVDDEADYRKRIANLKSGRVQMAVFTIDAFLRASAEVDGLPGTIALVIDETVGADAMVAFKAGVPSLEALNRPDAKFVLTPESPSEGLARVVMSSFDLPKLGKNPIERASGAADVLARMKKARTTEPQAFVLWEPYVSQALAIQGTHVLIDSSKFRGYIVDVLVVRREFALKNHAEVSTVIQAYLQTLYSVQQGGEAKLVELVMQDAARLKQPLAREQAEKLVRGIWWKNTSENYAHFGRATNEAMGRLPKLETMIRNVTNVLLRTGALATDPTEGQPGKLVFASPMQALYSNGFHPAGSAGLRLDGSRPVAAVVPLRDEEWSALVSVGRLQVDRVVFGRGTATLTEQGAQAIESLASTLNAFPSYYVTIRGQARQDGDPEANRQLAEDRAKTAAARLKSLGIVAERMRVLASEPAGADGEAQTVTFAVGEKVY